MVAQQHPTQLLLQQQQQQQSTSQPHVVVPQQPLDRRCALFILCAILVGAGVWTQSALILSAVCPINASTTAEAAVTGVLEKHETALRTHVTTYLNTTKFDLSDDSIEKIIANCTAEARQSRDEILGVVKDFGAVFRALGKSNVEGVFKELVQKIDRLDRDAKDLEDAKAKIRSLDKELRGVREELVTEKNPLLWMMLFVSVLIASMFSGQFEVSIAVAVTWICAGFAIRNTTHGWWLSPMAAFLFVVFYVALVKPASWMALMKRPAAVVQTTAITTAQVEREIVYEPTPAPPGTETLGKEPPSYASIVESTTAAPAPGYSRSYPLRRVLSRR